jgi:hypothetical protein
MDINEGLVIHIIVGVLLDYVKFKDLKIQTFYFFINFMNPFFIVILLWYLNIENRLQM